MIRLYILLFLLAIPICWFTPQAYYEVESFDWSYTEDLESRIRAGSGEEKLVKPVQSHKPSPDFASEVAARITAYTVRPEEGTNCVSASQRNICWQEENFAACPMKYPFFTEFLLDGEIWICVDRMNAHHRQFDNHFDLLFDDLDAALEFGVQYENIKIYK